MPVHIAFLLWLLTAVAGLTACRPAPDPEQLLISGERLRLSDQPGSPSLVVFWAPSCQVCRQEAPELHRLYGELAPRGLRLFAVAMAHSPPSHVLAAVESWPLPYPVALDLDGEVARAFGEVRLTPTLVLLDGDGREVLRHTGRTNFAALRNRLEALLEATSAQHS